MDRRAFFKKETSERKMNKKARLLSIWWFFVLAFIGGGVVIGVWIYYSADINVNKIEAEILAEKIMRCVSSNGYLDEGFLDFGEEEIFEKCGLKKEVFEKGSNFYFKIDVYEGDLIKEIEAGNGLFEKDCKISGKTISKHFPKCSEREESIIYGNKSLKLIVLAASNQEGRKVSYV